MPHGEVPHGDVRTLRDWLDDTADDCSPPPVRAHRAGSARRAQAHGSSLDIDHSKLHGRSVLIATREQLTAALALIEHRRRGAPARPWCRPTCRAQQLAAVVADAGIDALARR